MGNRMSDHFGVNCGNHWKKTKDKERELSIKYYEADKMSWTGSLIAYAFVGLILYGCYYLVKMLF